MEPVQTAMMLSEYGLYAIVAMLCFVSIHLYKKQGELEKEMRCILGASAKDTAQLLIEATNAIKQSNEAIKEMSGSITQMKYFMENCKQWSDK